MNTSDIVDTLPLSFDEREMFRLALEKHFSYSIRNRCQFKFSLQDIDIIFTGYIKSDKAFVHKNRSGTYDIYFGLIEQKNLPEMYKNLIVFQQILGMEQSVGVICTPREEVALEGTLPWGSLKFTFVKERLNGGEFYLRAVPYIDFAFFVQEPGRPYMYKYIPKMLTFIQ